MTVTASASTALLTTACQRWFEELSDRGIFTTDADLIVRTWNPWLETQTGIPAAAAVGEPLFKLLPALRERGLDHYYHDALEGEVRILSQRLHKYLFAIHRPASSGVTEMAQTARIAPLTTEEGIIGTITVIEDVTERVVSERELRNQIAASERARGIAEHASKLKDEFLATLSHEIRTPLNAVLGWARLLKTDARIRSRKRALDVIERNAMAQLRLVEDLLDMARVVSGKLRLDVSRVVLQDVVQAAIDVVRAAAAAKEIAIRFEPDGERTQVRGDADRLQQVAWNLLSNAVKFTPKGGRIEVRLERAGPTLFLTVRDSGEGISEEFLPFVFDRFRQADASPSRRHGGLGLGLALVRQIVELHGGAVTVESPGKDQGATFRIELPIAHARGRTSRARMNADPSLAGTSVLLVDDNEDARDLLSTALRSYGARVRVVGSVDKALRALSRPGALPDVLISDIGMPSVDGYDLIQRIREPGAIAREVPAIAVTAYANPEDRLRALSAGYQAHLVKPVELAAVATAIARLGTRR
jgi:PAS domain S-box-containing protein